MSEPESRTGGATARSQSVVHIQDRNHDKVVHLLAAALERAADGPAPGALVIVPSSEDAVRLAAARAVAAGPAGGGPVLTPITSVTRGRRLLAGGPAVVVGAPAELAPLVRESRLQPGGIRALVLVWPEEVVAAGDVAALEGLLADVPRGTERVAVVARRDQQVDEFLDRVMWRARHVDHVDAAAPAPVAVQYAVVAASQRIHALRAILDARDPETMALVAEDDPTEQEANLAARSLGGTGEAGLIQVARGAPPLPVSVAVLYGAVPSPEELRAIATRAGEVVALVDPARVTELHRAAGGGATPLSVGAASARARSSLEGMRDALREAVARGVHIPWVTALEPLLDEVDPVELAAAAAALLDRERRGKVRAQATPTAAGQEPLPAPVRPGAQRPPRPGRREDVPRGGPRRHEREDLPGGGSRRHERDGQPRGGPRRHEREDRPGRGGAGRPARPGPGSREGRPGRDAGRGAPPRDAVDRLPRAAREGAEWAARGERLRHARRRREDR